jgi:hypothetical protein
MNSIASQPSAADTAHNITEADVVAFLVAKVAELADRNSEPYSILQLEILNGSPSRKTKITWGAYTHGDTFRRADTIEGAISASVAAMSPAVRARELREKAAAMLAEAANLAPLTDPDDDMRVVVTDESGAEQSRDSLGNFVRDNEDDSFDISAIAAELRRSGSFTWNGGAGGVFTLRPETAA